MSGDPGCATRCVLMSVRRERVGFRSCIAGKWAGGSCNLGGGAAVRSGYGGRGSVAFFFFSSRRRHTRSDRDWSSDVCSSDLQPPAVGGGRVYITDSNLDDLFLKALDPSTGATLWSHQFKSGNSLSAPTY